MQQREVRFLVEASRQQRQLPPAEHEHLPRGWHRILERPSSTEEHELDAMLRNRRAGRRSRRQEQMAAAVHARDAAALGTLSATCGRCAVARAAIAARPCRRRAIELEQIIRRRLLLALRAIGRRHLVGRRIERRARMELEARGDVLRHGREAVGEVDVEGPHRLRQALRRR